MRDLERTQPSSSTARRACLRAGGQSPLRLGRPSSLSSKLARDGGSLRIFMRSRNDGSDVAAGAVRSRDDCGRGFCDGGMRGAGGKCERVGDLWSSSSRRPTERARGAARGNERDDICDTRGAGASDGLALTAMRPGPLT